MNLGGKSMTITNQPFGNSLYDLFMVIGCDWRMVYYCFTHIKPLLVGGLEHEWIIFHVIYGMSSETH